MSKKNRSAKTTTKAPKTAKAKPETEQPQEPTLEAPAEAMPAPEVLAEEAPAQESPVETGGVTETALDATATSEEPVETSAPSETQAEALPPEAPSEAPLDAAPDANSAAKPTTETATAKRSRKPNETKPKKVSALDAAAQVLAAKGAPMTAPELIAAMAEQGLWTSPGGKTPAATLYAAMLREITTKGTESRFTRPERGKFARRVEA